MSTRTLRRRLALAAVAVLLLAAPAGADYKQSYKNGIKASDRKDWTGVARFMQQAIAEQPQENAEKLNIYGMIYLEYLPHYYLGMALKESGDCAGALRELAISEQQGVVQNTGSYGNLTKARDACRQQVPVAPPPTQVAVAPTAVPVNIGPSVQKAEAAITAATEAANAFNTLRQNPEYAAVWQAAPDLSARAEQSVKKLEQARGRLVLGRSSSSVVEIEGAAGQASDAARELVALREQAGVRRAEVAQQQADALKRAEEERKSNLVKDINAKLADARAVQAQAAAQKPPTPDVQRQSADLGQAIADAAKASTLDVARLEELQGRLLSATAVLRDTLSRPAEPGKPSVPAELRQAAQLFLAAEWTRVVGYLQGRNLDTPKANATVALLRGAARFAMLVEGGEKDAALRQQSEADIRTCRQLDAAVVPTVKSFSPRFVEFFQRVR